MARAWVVTHSLGRKWVGKSTDASQVLDALPTEAGQARQLAVALHSVARWQRYRKTSVAEATTDGMGGYGWTMGHGWGLSELQMSVNSSSIFQ